MDRLGDSTRGAPRLAGHTVPAARHPRTTSRRSQALSRALEPIRPLTQHGPDPHLAHGMSLPRSGWGRAGQQLSSQRLSHLEMSKTRQLRAPLRGHQACMTTPQNPRRPCVKRASDMRQICVKITHLAHVTPIMHTRQTCRSAGLLGGLQNRHALHVVRHRKHVEPKQVKEIRRSGACSTQNGRKIDVHYVRDGHYVRSLTRDEAASRAPRRRKSRRMAFEMPYSCHG